MTIDIYSQYFSAELNLNNIERHAALVKLTSDSEDGHITYTAAITFFPHNDEYDYLITYDAYYEKVLYDASGRRSSKREKKLLSDLKEEINALAEQVNGKVFWERPLREAVFS